MSDRALVLSGSGKGGWAFGLYEAGTLTTQDSGGRPGARSWAMLCEALVQALPHLPDGPVTLYVRNEAFVGVIDKVGAGERVKTTPASRRLVQALEQHRERLRFACAHIDRKDPLYAPIKEAAVQAAPEPDAKAEPPPLPDLPPLQPTELWIWTDGGCRLKPDGIGGWGALIVHAGSGASLELWGGEPGSTNNRMELSAVIHALNSLSRPAHIELRVDSTYVRNVATKWGAKWKRYGWKKLDGEPVANQDLVIALDQALSRHRVHWTWVKGHAGEPGNTRADALCLRAMDAQERGEPHAGQTRMQTCPIQLPPRAL